jgi:rhomboid protease GluP
MPRQTTGSILCPSCGQLISVNSEVCIHCGQRRPGLWGFGPMLRNFLGDYGFTEIFFAFCVLLYGVSLILDPKGILQNFLSPSMRSLDALGMTGAYAIQQSRWWTLITAIFLHGNLLHIYFNLSSIRQLAPAVEEFFGTSRLILIFMISGMLGFAVSNWRGIPFTVGASGSLFGLLGALVYYGRDRGGAFGTTIFKQSWQGALANLLLGFFIPVVNNWAHIGGFVSGYLAALLLGYTEKRRENLTMQLLAISAMALTVLAFGIVAWKILF